ncbi:MAG: TonB-dependent receptor [Candidatus Omnitrophota bacterium]|jgi:iron complex outermembrane receptor protein
MQKEKACGLFFIIIILSAGQALFAGEELSLDLEPIVITKSDIYLTRAYILKSDTLLPFASWSESLTAAPLDLQSRTLKADIQTDFSLRGSSYQGVSLLIDGQRVNDPKLGHYNCDLAITREDIERIEVIPGAGSSIFGPDAIGGAVNIILKKPREKKRILESSFGSYQTKSGIFSITERKDNLGVRLSLERQESGGFYYDTDFKRLAATLNSSLDIPIGEFNLGLGYLEKEFGAYDFYTPGRGYASKEWIKSYLLNTGFNLKRDGLIIKPNFLWRRHEDKFMLDKDRPALSLNHHHSDVYTPNIYLQKETEALGRIGLGLEYGEEQISSTVLGKHQRSHNSIFIDDNKELNPKLSLGSSARSDDYAGFDRAYTGSLNLRYKISGGYSLHLGVSRSIRIPTFHELYYEDVTTTGDAGLSCEKSLNYESGLDYKQENFLAGTTFFLRQEKGFIDWVKRAPAQSKWKTENITEAEVYGIENYLRSKINQKLNLNSNYTYIDKRINDRGYLYKYGPNYIKHLFNTMLSFNLPFGEQAVGLTYKKKPGRRGWLLLHTAFSYNLNKTSQVFLKITNLLNVEYQEIEGIPQPGRWLEAGLRFEW